MKHIIVTVFIIVIFLGVIKIFTPKYNFYMLSGSEMVKLPSGIGINASMTKKEAEELIANPRTRLQCYAEEMLEYIKYRNAEGRK